MVFLRDALTLDKPRRSTDGYVRVRARAAKVGVQDYLGIEIDPTGKQFKPNDVVKVYRSADEVFSKESLASFALRPITDDHPTEAVNASNWRDHARGTIVQAGKEVADDGEYVGFDLAFMDGETVGKLDSGKRELSGGYSCDLVIGDGVTPDGTPFNARQTNIRGNHVALVTRGRAGPACRVSDAEAQPFAACDAIPAALAALTTPSGDIPMKTLTIDGLRVPNVSDEAEAAITKLQAAIADAVAAKTTAETQVATLTTDKATLEAEKTTLEKQVADAKLTPQMLRDAAKAYALTVDKAKALGVAVADDADEAAIQKAVVAAKLGDVAKDWNDTQIAASFATLTKDAKIGEPQVQSIGAPKIIGDSATVVATARAAWLADKQGAHRAQPTA